MEKQDVQRTEINKGKLISALGAIAQTPSEACEAPCPVASATPQPPGAYRMKAEKKKSDSHVAASYVNATGQASAPAPSLE